MTRQALLSVARRAALVSCLGCAVSPLAAAPPAAPDDHPPAPRAALARQHRTQTNEPARTKQLGQGEAARLAQRDRHRAILAALWGSAGTQPAGLAEFALHAWRMARLRRMEQLATELARPLLLERIGTLLAKEQTRHLKHMKRLQNAAPPTSAQSSPKTPPAQRRAARKD